MLNREQASAQLKQYAAPESSGGGARRGLLSRLFGGPLVTELEQCLDPRRSEPDRSAELARRLDELDPARRVRVFCDLAPQLGAALARWWVWAQAAPYQQGWGRRGFRSPDPDTSRPARMAKLGFLIRLARAWPQDAAWFATWASHLDPWRTRGLSEVFASEIDAGDPGIAETLLASALGRHPVSGITVGGIQGLLGCADPTRWEQVATLLRNAGRQEGLRSAVLEATDLAHPRAFARILDVVVDDDLARFAGTVRAAGVWFGEELDVRTPGLAAALAELRDIVSDPVRIADPEQERAVPREPRRLFLWLWALALQDALAAAGAARMLLIASPDPLIRRAAARLLAELGLASARDALQAALADEDLGVYANAISAWPASPVARDRAATLDDATMGLLLERVRTLGKAQQVDTGVIGRRVQTISAAQAADVILAHRTLAAAPPEAVGAASADGRFNAVRVLAQQPRENRTALFGFLADPSSTVRGVVITALETLPSISDDEALLLEGLLRRKASDLRRGAVTMLLRQPAAQLRGSVDRLSAGTVDQARAAAELAEHAGIAGRVEPTSPDDAVTPPATGPTVTVLGRDLPAELVPRPDDRTPAVAPRRPQRDWTRYQAGCRLVVTSLRGWLDEHADVEVRVSPTIGGDPSTGGAVELLANVRWLPRTPAGRSLPLPEVLGPWWERIGPQLADGGVELLLLRLATPHVTGSVPERWLRAASERVLGAIPAGSKESPLLWQVIHRVAEQSFRPSWIDLALDAAETLWHDLPVSDLLGPETSMRARGRTISTDRRGRVSTDVRGAFADPADLLPLDALSDAQLGRLWRLARFVDEPEGTLDVVTAPSVEFRPTRQFYLGGQPPAAYPVFDQPWRARPPVELLARAVAAGHATRGDVVDALLELDRPFPNAGGFRRSGSRRDALRMLSGRRGPEWANTPEVVAALEQVRAAALDSELHRGELTAPLTRAARALRSSSGVDGVVSLLNALGSRPFARGYAWTDSRESSLSHLVRTHFPAPGETANDLSAALTAARIRPRRAVEFAVYAPQWAAMVEHHLGWDGFESAVWWVHAHTKDEGWSVDHEIRDEWASAVAQRTPLDAVDLTRGAADVAWFSEVIGTLGEDRFAQVLAAAKYASTSGGHKRAELFATALLGRVEEAALRDRIRTKRHQDSVRALGLLPITGRDDPAVPDRYQLLRGFVASDRSSGSARRASETTAAAIGMENLARTAGYRDPGRLTWAMEADAVRDLAAGPMTASDGTVTVSLTVDATGAPDLTVTKNGKPLKAVPAGAAKHPDIAPVRARVGELRAQARRMRSSLEQSCITGEQFDVAELVELFAHPIVAPMLRTLVLVSGEGVIGFPAPTFADSPALRGPESDERPLDGSPLRIAHPVDLLDSGEWPALQRAAFRSRTTQPFRQLFRELYVPTDAETGEAPASRRYAGQQVEQRRAAGLFTSRGWVADFEIGFGRTFHTEKITGWCGVLNTFGTPGEVEDATIEDVTFTPAGRWSPIPVADVPPRLFSEVMRDLDLVVSVAHAGGVDPDTSESAVSMRGRLVEETADLLALSNVEVTDHHALVRGTLGRYSVHLGSGQVHRVPGNAICIIPVSAQHRGRIFLPFADDDPRTAEVISKVVLLARDERIQDPTILGQLT